MRPFSQLLLATLASLVTADFIGPFNIQPFGEVVLEISAKNTLNSTNPINYLNSTAKRSEDEVAVIDKRQSSNLVFRFSQFAFGRGTKVNVYITGIDKSNDGHTGAMGFVDKNGHWYYPKGNPSSSTPTPVDPQYITIPIPDDTSQFNVTLPGAIDSGQVLVAVNGTLTFMTNVGTNGVVSLVNPTASNSQDPSINVFWGFSEFSFDGAAELFINPTSVDFAGKSGTPGNFSAGLLPNGAVRVANIMYSQNQKDGQPWNQLVRYNNKNQLVRVLAPTDYKNGSFNAGDAFNGYWENYIDQVYSMYTNQKLTLNAGGKQSTCQVSNNVMSCTGDDKTYAKPTTADIFSCNTGPFGNIRGGNAQHQLNVPVLCAGFVRSTLLTISNQPSGPPTTYYTHNPTDWYAYAVHNSSYEINGPPGVGYAFQFDDVNPNGAIDQSGTVHRTDATQVQFFIGGYTNPGQYNPGQYA